MKIPDSAPNLRAIRPTPRNLPTVLAACPAITDDLSAAIVGLVLLNTAPSEHARRAVRREFEPILAGLSDEHFQTAMDRAVAVLNLQAPSGPPAR